MEGTTQTSNGEAREERGTITGDKESTTMVRILKLLGDLLPAERGRILTYVFSKYGQDCN